MSADDLDTKTDAQLDELFAVEIAQIPEFTDSIGTRRIIPPFCADANAVLPWLEKAGWRGVGNRAGSTCASTIEVLIAGGPATATAQADYTTTQNTFARAAVIALLRAKRVSK